MILMMLDLLLELPQVDLFGKLLIKFELDVQGLLQGDISEGLFHLRGQGERPGRQGRHPERLRSPRGVHRRLRGHLHLRLLTGGRPSGVVVIDNQVRQ